MNKDNNHILNGKAEAEKMLLDLKKNIAKLKTKPTLAVILVGHDPASKVYVGIKEKRAKELGVNFVKYHLPASVGEKEVINLIHELNSNKKITGILLQLPLPKKNNTHKVISAIAIKKDVDGLNSSKLISPTIQSILRLIKLSKQKLINKKAVILCHSQEFAESLKKELLQHKTNVDILLKHDFKTLNSSFLNRYSIIVIALGQKHFLKPEMIKKDAVIIDVGINRFDKKIFGDVDPRCFKKTRYISPVPGGVGPLTVAYLFKNLLKLKNPS